jgi:Tfp pilus assembly PilM family ATPase
MAQQPASEEDHAKPKARFDAGMVRDWVRKFNRGPADLLGVDVGSSGIKLVRMRKTSPVPTLVAAGILPPLELPSDAEVVEISPLAVPAPLRARHVSLALTGENALIKLMSFPGNFSAGSEHQIVAGLGIEDAEAYRVGYKVVAEGHGRSETRLLATALPFDDAAIALALFPIGLPAPFSLEVAGLATLTTFLHGPARAHAEESVATLDLGARISYFSIFNRNRLLLLRKFPFGMDAMIDRVQHLFGLDADTARGALSAGAIDLSQMLAELMEPFLKQLIISRDFVERRYGGALAALYVCGAAASSKDWIAILRTAFGMDPRNWNPLADVVVADGALPPALAGQEHRLSAAVGACLGAFEDT